MRGEILRYDDVSGAGLISGDDGVRYTFSRSDLQQLSPVKPGEKVDFAPVGETATQIFLIPGAIAQQAAAGPARNVWQNFTYCIGKYVDGHGRANRSEYWSFVLFESIFVIVALCADAAITAAVKSTNSGDFFLPIFTCIVLFGLALPGLALMIRRFHDLGMSGWFLLIGFIPYIGGLFTFVISLIPGQVGSNKHGPGPGQSFS